MAGVSDVGYRAIACHFGAEIAFSEMVSAKGLVYGEGKAPKYILTENFEDENSGLGSNKSAWLLLTEPQEKVKAVQLFGSEPKFFEMAINSGLLDKFDIIDINMGCPAPKIIRNGEGSALLENFELAFNIIKTCKQSTNKPITVKFRKGFKSDVCEEFAKLCERAGADAITIHGRLMKEGYGGVVDYEAIKKVKASVKIPVIGSGDVRDLESLKRMLSCGVDGVMIGRASQGNLEIFKLLSESLSGKKTPMVEFVLKDDFFKDVLTEEDLENLARDERYIKFICAKKHTQILRKYFQDSFLVKYMRKHYLWYCSGFRSPEKKILLAKSLDIERSLELLKQIIIENLF